MMFKFNRSDLDHRRSTSLFDVAQRTITLLAVLGASVAVMGAQTSAPSLSQTGGTTQQSIAQPQLSFQVPAKDALFSSSADENAVAPTIEASVVPTTPDFSKMMQYGSGQGYNRARYRRNSDEWNNIATFYVGGGATVPLGNMEKYYTPNYDVQVGVGPRFGKHFALPVEFDWHEFGVTGQTLNSQSTIYFGTTNVGLDGNSHIWSFSLEPTYTIHSGDSMGAYIVAGVGYYHKVTNFTLPGRVRSCYWYCGVFEENVNIDHYTSNAPGYDAGFGLTYKVSRDSGVQLYTEARYVFVDNSQRYGITDNSASIGTINNGTTDFFPENSNHTTYIPVTFGIRF